MPPQEQADLWMALRDRMKGDWHDLTLQERKAGTWTFAKLSEQPRYVVPFIHNATSQYLIVRSCSFPWSPLPQNELNLMTLFEYSILDRLRPPRSPLPSPTGRELVGIQNDRPRLRHLYRFILDYTAICATGTKDYERTVAGDVK